MSFFSIIEKLGLLFYIDLKHNPEDAFDLNRDRFDLYKRPDAPAFNVFFCRIWLFSTRGIVNTKKV